MNPVKQAAKKASGSEFPKITIDLAIKYIERIVNNTRGQVVSYIDIGNSIRKKGGNLARIVTALKEFGLIEKSGVSAWRITELGQKIASSQNPADIFRAFINPSVHSSLWGEFKGGKPTKDVLIRHIEKSEHIKGMLAGKLAKLFLKDYEYIFSLPKPEESLKGVQEPLVKMKFDKDMIRINKLVWQLFPLESKENVINRLKELLKLAESKNMYRFSGFIESLILTLQDEQDEQKIVSELKKFSQRAIDIFESELGVKVDINPQ